MQPKIFDTHAHYDSSRFADDCDAVLASMPKKGIGLILNAACDLKSSLSSQQLAERYPFVYASAGIHPHESKDVPPDWERQLKQFATHEKCVAIGEIGLDYHYDFSPRETQRELFAAQMEVASELKLPVIIHEREALTDTLDILRAFNGRVHGVFHCFSNSLETARIVLDLDYDIALGGTVTFKNARHAPLVAAGIPIDRLLVETDCPYMAPVPFRGKRCDSSMISLVAETIAAAREISVDEILNTTKQNADKLFLKNAHL